MKKFLKVVLIIILIILIPLAVVYTMVSIPKKTVDVTFSEQDLQSYVQKGNITFVTDVEKRATAEDMLSGNFTATGVSSVDTFVTNEEVTSLLNSTSANNSMFKDIKMKFLGNDTMEASAVIGENLDQLMAVYPEVKKYEQYLTPLKGKTVYAKTYFKLVAPNTFDAVLQEVYVGSMPITTDLVNQNMKSFGSAANRTLSNIPGLNIEKFDVTDKGFDFKGTIPKEIQALAK